MPQILAVLCFRNELPHIRRCLTDLIADKIDVVVIDNDSTDGSRDVADSFLGKGVVGIERLPWTGAFSLSDQLRAKQSTVKKYGQGYDWIIHIDADELLLPPWNGLTLRDGIAQADSTNATHINFLECVFLPLNRKKQTSTDYVGNTLHYYFFSPSYPRLQRAWRNIRGVENIGGAGHRLHGAALQQYEHDFILRHYIVLSEEHAQQKYADRVFSDEDLAKGWHGNRRNLVADKLIFRPNPCLKMLKTAEEQDMDLSTPVTKHFWQWS